MFDFKKHKKTKEEGLGYIDEHSGFVSANFSEIDPDFHEFCDNAVQDIKSLVATIDVDWRNASLYDSIIRKFVETHIAILEKHTAVCTANDETIVIQLQSKINYYNNCKKAIEFKTQKIAEIVSDIIE